MGDRKNQILDAAAGLIHRQGYQSTTIDDVLKASGVGKGNFYYYFRSKEELGYAVMDRFEAIFDEQVFPVLRTTDLDPVSRIEALLDRSVEAARENGCAGGCPMGNLALELSDVHEGFRQRLSGIFERLAGQVEKVLREGRSTFRPGMDPARVAWFMVASLEGGILLAKVRRDPAVLGHTADEVKRHLRSCLVQN